jgi:hypothetical protein
MCGTVDLSPRTTPRTTLKGQIMANIEIVDFVPVRPANPFDEHVSALVAAGEGKALAVTCSDDEYKSVKRKFREAATNAGFSARIRDEVHGPNDAGEDEWTITFTLKPRPTEEEKAERAAKRAAAAENASRPDADKSKTSKK